MAWPASGFLFLVPALEFFLAMFGTVRMAPLPGTFTHLPLHIILSNGREQGTSNAFVALVLKASQRKAFGNKATERMALEPGSRSGRRRKEVSCIGNLFVF
jgi:hypothetical protein